MNTVKAQCRTCRKEWEYDRRERFGVDRPLCPKCENASVPSPSAPAGEKKLDEMKRGLESVGIKVIEPTDERNLAGRFMVNKGVVMGGKPLPLADVQTWLTEYGAERYNAGLSAAPPPLDRGEFEKFRDAYVCGIKASFYDESTVAKAMTATFKWLAAQHFRRQG